MTALGATWHPDANATSFALWSRHATAVELCLFDHAGDRHAARRIALEGDGNVWHVTVPEVGPGQCYGYRVNGPWQPQAGHRFNPSKLLVDPYARAITGEPDRNDAVFAHDPRRPLALDSYSGADSAGAMPKSVVIDPRFDWQDDAPPRVPWSETILYECHVRGMTMRHRAMPAGARGRYAGLAVPAVVDHLRGLGVTTVALMPVCQFATEPVVAARGLVNYWGYSPLGYFAPHAGYAHNARGGQQVVEFKAMVRALHAAGLEVVVDMVFNHTAEGGADGPTFSMRGIDNASYYRLATGNRRRYVDMTGCGNTLDASQPVVRRLVLDCLRYWVQELHVDGFRYDLAPTLGRDARGRFAARGGLLEAIARDPVLATVKHMAEPWDLGPNGYRRGAFPSPWAEWDDRFRDDARGFWRGDATSLARRLGEIDTDGPSQPVQFVTCHDGFTLADLVSYEHKHNRGNGEDNRDGSNHNRSRNWGVEGPSGDPRIGANRRRAQRNLLATLMLAPGTPMLNHGDEMGRSQGGNNNAYCQDNDVAWMPWPDLDTGTHANDLRAFVARLAALRQRVVRCTMLGPSTYFGANGQLLANDALATRAAVAVARGPLLLLLNRQPKAVRFALPAGDWQMIVDTADDHGTPNGETIVGTRRVEALALVALLSDRDDAPPESS